MTSDSAHPDNKYIHALLNNDQLLVSEIYSKFSPKIISMIRRNNGSMKDAQDIFQEALIIIFNKAVKGGFTLTCPFEGFLYLICKRKWLNELKKRGRAGVTTDEDGLSTVTEDTVTLAEEAEADDNRSKLFWEKFKLLGARCQELLKLSWGGISMEEVSNQMDVTYGYARKKKSECIARLMKLVKESPEYQLLKMN